MKLPTGLRAVLTSLTLVVLALPGLAQDFRGAINGTVRDSSGGVLPGVTVTVRNVETNVAQTTVTDSKGFYQVSRLLSGHYSVEVALEGLKTVIRRGLVVRVGDTLAVDFAMEPGGVSETIEVVAATPVLDTTSANTGQVIDSNQIQQLPLGDGTAYMLSRLAPGVMDSSDLHFSRPMDNGNLAGIVANGALGGNDFTLDGAPNRVSPNNTTNTNNNGVVGFSPPSDAIAEFKVQTNAFDAESGHTAGATVNLALKSGTNAWQGTAAYFNRDDARSATPLLTERAGDEKPTREYNRYTATLSGPILRDRTFFMVAVERLRDIQPEPSFYTVPTLRMREGDFSEWVGGGNNVLIYDPATATGSNRVRTAFAGNVIPATRINPVARAYANLYPEPNRAGLEDNYFTNMLRPYDYSAALIRLDHNFNGSNRLFGNGYWNKREEDRYNWALGAPNADGDTINGVAVTKGFDYRSNTGATLGYTSVISSNVMFDLIGSWSQFGEWRQPGADFDPASLGFAPEAVALMDGYPYLPFITFGGFSTTNANSRLATLGSQRSDFGTGFDRPFTNTAIVPTLDYLIGGHAIRTGYELRHQRWQIDNAGYGAGRFHFSGAYTRANNSAAQNILAQSWAQFLLGIPTTGTGTPGSPGATSSQFEIVSDADYSQVSHSLFVQDDWRFGQRLNLNMGVRLEFDRGMTEADDRNVSGFDVGMSNPIEAQAIAAYARNPIAELPVDRFRVRGGLEFADGPIYEDLFKVLPRMGFAYMLTPKTVLRGGAGLFSYQYYFDAGNQAGFSQATPIITTTDSGLTFTGANLQNPLPGGQLNQPTGASLGALTNLGFTVGTVVPSEREIPYYTRWQIGAQHDLGAGWVVEAFYVGSRGRNLPVTRELNGLPVEFLSTSRLRDTTHETFLSQTVPNPFAGLLPNSSINGTTIARSQLLRPFPHYLAGSNNGAVAGTGTISVGTEEYIGSDQYDAGSLRVEKRFHNGNSLLATYTRSKLSDKLNFLNPSDGVLEERISPNDRTHRGTLGATIRLPFGEGQHWGSEWKGIRQALLGGWRVSATYQYQTGFPLQWNTNIYYDPNRDPRDLRGHIGGNCPDGGTAGLDCAAWDIGGFYPADGPGRTDPRIVLGNNVRYFPSTLPHVRTDDLHLMDVGVYKTFGLLRDVDLQVRIEFINALNYTVLWNPNQDPTNANFGKINQDRNNPRDVQIGARLTF